MSLFGGVIAIKDIATILVVVFVAAKCRNLGDLVGIRSC